ncbi:Mitochondrial distribution and morphology protein 34 [Erysiphe neolycopersici]|uniref:Mitochondrial distribution and morphology protein 34 n=1 Tax=Erysiphe neolycopersici TaxID=212602 RepID=A0A420HP65_9PEZI|nr:Mitochondrial distribution and morphology protein 34 [Erysiphe neolycopersici]
MAFNFNWSPLTADADFYKRAQEMLTTALNKSPKPPIIVDDIIVNELNLGTVPPELEILEIGDLAEDRFRGIFKMCYSGDAFLTLKTKVQANPMNTYLSSTSSFTSPRPLAAASGLMIPLQITLSEIKLSAFIILVFSRQKGLTLVFRNDPLESLKVSSTFDSIPFVRDYLQKEIEIQLRTLMMDELPAIIHRLSLRLWCTDYVSKELLDVEPKIVQKEPAIDPFTSSLQDTANSRGNALDANDISLSLDGSAEKHLLFSQKNLVRLSTLRDSHKTLSLFTPSIRDAVFRAWASPLDRADTAGTTTPLSPGLRRTHSITGTSNTIYKLNQNSDDGPIISGISSFPSNISLPSTTGLSLGSTRNARAHLRKKKTRVINLRKPKTTQEKTFDNSKNLEKLSEPIKEQLNTDIIEPEDKIITPPSSPSHRVRFRTRKNEILEIPHESCHTSEKIPFIPTTNIQSKNTTYNLENPDIREEKSRVSLKEMKSCHDDKSSQNTLATQNTLMSNNVLGHAWILKIANELARRSPNDKFRSDLWLHSSEEDVPPAYDAKGF